MPQTEKNGDTLKRSTKTITITKTLKLSCGVSLEQHDLVYETYGHLNKAKNNAILICHALSGNHHAAGKDDNGNIGWWDNYIGPNKAIDTNKFFVVSLTNIGSCFGSTGPNAINPKTGKYWATEFPTLHVTDWVNSQKMLMDAIQIKGWIAVIGGSLGGMQVMEWSVLYPNLIKNSVIIAAALKLSAQNIAFNEIARRSIKSDENFKNGDYLNLGLNPSKGLALARMVGHITYLSDDILGRKFGRSTKNVQLENQADINSEFEIASYLNYQGDKFKKSFDANSYILITQMLDMFNFESDSKSNKQPFEDAKCKFLIISFTSDWRFSPECSNQIVQKLMDTNKRVTYLKIESDKGHDSFLLPDERYENGLRVFLNRALEEFEELNSD